MEQADLIWMNGEFVAWEDAKVHVLTHGLHYGTGVFEGVRCYDTEIGPAVFRHADHVDRLLQARPSSTTCRSRSTAEQLRAGDARARSPATACAPATSARSSSAATGTMGLFPLDAPVDVTIAVLGVGRLPRRGGQAQRRAREGLLAGGGSARTR